MNWQPVWRVVDLSLSIWHEAPPDSPRGDAPLRADAHAAKQQRVGASIKADSSGSHLMLGGESSVLSSPATKARLTDILKSSAASEERWGITSDFFLHGIQSRGGHAIHPGVENPVALFRTVESHCAPEREQIQGFRALTWPQSAKGRARRRQVL